MKEIKRYVLTGGPCAGKTSAQKRVKEEFEKLGYKVILVDEAATILILAGNKPGKNISVKDFQDKVIKKQLELEENAIKEAMESESDKVLILYDRGLRDGRAYLDEETFQELLKQNELKDEELNDRYDAVFYLVTSAIGAEKYYNLENKARSETLEEARELDLRTRDAWKSHESVTIIDNSTEFEEKINRLIESMISVTDEINNCIIIKDYPVIFKAFEELEIPILELKSLKHIDYVNKSVIELFKLSYEELSNIAIKRTI